jgi:hypothetical protein
MSESSESNSSTDAKDGAGDEDRTRDIQLGKLKPTLRSTQNQSHKAGGVRSNVALSALIEHDSEHKFLTGGFL